MKRLWSLIGLAGLIVLIGCMDIPVAPQPTSASYEDDAKILRAGLMELYPSLDRFGQEQAVLAALDDLDALAKTTTDPMAFYRAVAAVAAAAKDEHVIPFPSSEYRQSRRDGKMMLPYTVKWMAGEPYVAAVADPANEGIIGQRVLAFDGQEASEVRDTLKATIPSDGLSETFAIRRLEDFTPTQNENYFDLNYPLWFGARDIYAITTVDEAGNTEFHEMSALAWPAFLDFYGERLPRAVPMTFEWLEGEIGYLSVLSFHGWYYDEHRLNSRRLLGKIFRELKERPGASLILDLRRNEGGGDISTWLLDYLLTEPFTEYDRTFTRFVGQPDAAQYCENANEVAFQEDWVEPVEGGLFELNETSKRLITGATERTPKKDAFEGDIVVLISGATGSAAAKVSAVLDRENRATFVGEETGGAAAGATAYGYCGFLLPYAGIKVDMPLVRFERELDVPYGRGVLPDVAVDAGRVPPITDTDEVLSAALSLLGERDEDEPTR